MGGDFTAWVSAQAYPGLFHETFNEPERALVLARLTQWLHALLVPKPRPAHAPPP